jgi:serine/threonine-protein kinase
MEPRWIWPFELLNKLGEGGMGVVYRARYVRNDRQVAVKLLPADAAENKTLLARFEREMEVLKQLDHPNIVHCFGGTCEGEQRFYAMELVECGTLADLLRRKERLTWDVAIDYAIQMCHALDYAHERGVIHRDVKPSNFLITKQGQLKLSDFGLVTVAAGRRLTASGRTMGTVEYMSPEQIRGKPPLTNRSDLYALGCVIHEMLTGHPPYSGETPVEVMHKHITEPIPHIARGQFDGPIELDELLCELLAKKPDLRPDSAGTVGRRLEDILQPGRRFVSAESTQWPLRTAKDQPVSKVEEIHPNALLSDASLPTGQSKATWSWLVAALLTIFCLIGWSGWRSSNRSVRVAERVMADYLASSDTQTQIFAAKSLAKFGRLQATTITSLNNATKNGSDAVIQAALMAVAAHADECRPLQWEIYKLQQNGQVSTEVRYQAGRTFDAIKNASVASNTSSIIFWSLLVVFLVAATASGWIIRRRFVAPVKATLGGRE